MFIMLLFMAWSLFCKELAFHRCTASLELPMPFLSPWLPIPLLWLELEWTPLELSLLEPLQSGGEPPDPTVLIESERGVSSSCAIPESARCKHRGNPCQIKSNFFSRSRLNIAFLLFIIPTSESSHKTKRNTQVYILLYPL